MSLEESGSRPSPQSPRGGCREPGIDPRHRYLKLPFCFSFSYLFSPMARVSRSALPRNWGWLFPSHHRWLGRTLRRHVDTDLVLFVVKSRSGAEKNPLVQLSFQLVEPFSLFIVEKGDDLGVSFHGDVAGIGVKIGLFTQLPQDIPGNGRHRADVPFPFAIRARVTQVALQALARTLTRHLYKAQFADFA